MSDSKHSVPAPRLYCISATAAPTVLVFRRGPSDWFHILKWRLDRGVVEPGVWVRKKLFPRRCDLSADGELWLYYLSGGFDRYRVYAGVARVPWLHPLHSWDERDTWGGGWCFSDEQTSGSQPVVVNSGQVWIARNNTPHFGNELRRGWREAIRCSKDMACLEKAAPDGGTTLRMIGAEGLKEGPFDFHSAEYELASHDRLAVPLPDATWADWDARGRLLIATTTGRLRIEEVRDKQRVVVEEHDLNGLKPNPMPPPDHALA